VLDLDAIGTRDPAGLIDDPAVAELYLGVAARQRRGSAIMKAVVFDAHGALENMQYRDAPDPTPGPQDCVVRVRAVALNGFDPMVLRGIPGLKTPLPIPPGRTSPAKLSAGAESIATQWAVGDRSP